MNISVLIVEDNIDAQNILKKILVHMGINPIIHGQGDHAIEYLAKNAPSIVLLDMNLPVVDGHGVLKYIRAEKHLAKTL